MFLRFLYVDPAQRRQSWASRMLQALHATAGGRAWKTSGLIPETIPSALFEKNGYVREPINQLEMVHNQSGSDIKGTGAP